MTPDEQQKSSKEIWLDFARDALGAERGFYFTVKSLYTKPNDVFNDYLSGGGRYVSPFGLLGVSFSIYYLISGYLVDWTAVADSVKWLFRLYADWLNANVANAGNAIYDGVLVPYIDGLILLASTYVIVIVFVVELLFIPFLTFFTRKHGLMAYHHVIAINYNLSLSFLMIDVLILMSLISPWLIIPTYIAAMFVLPKRSTQIYGDKQKMAGKALIKAFIVFFLACAVIGMLVGIFWGFLMSRR